MMKKIKKKYYVGIFILLFFMPCFVLSQASFDVVINEIAWMGIEENSYSEWIELYNNTDKDIDLTGWYLVSDEGKININLEGQISPNGYYFLLKNTTGKVPNISPSQIYQSGSMKNNGEYLFLKNENGETIDEVDCSSEDGWFAGDNNLKASMERINSLVSGNDPNNWHTNSNGESTPKAINSDEEDIIVIPEEEIQGHEDEEEMLNLGLSAVGQDDEIPVSAGMTIKAIAGDNIEVFAGQEILFDASFSQGITDETKYFWNFGDGYATTTQKAFHSYLYPGEYIATLKIIKDNFSDTAIKTIKVLDNHLIISEIMPNPKGKDDNEWIEIYNKSEQVVDISEWQIDDEEGGSNAFVFSENTFVASGQYLVLPKSMTKISLKNTSDSARILTPEGIVVDQVIYENVEEAQSLNRVSNERAIWSTMLTPGAKNMVMGIEERTVSFLNSPIVVAEHKKEISTNQVPKNIVQKTAEIFYDNFVLFAEAREIVDLKGVEGKNIGIYGENEVFIINNDAPQPFGTMEPTGIQDTKNNEIPASAGMTEREYKENDNNQLALLPESANITQKSEKTAEIQEKKDRSAITITFCIGALAAFAIAFIDKKMKVSS